MRCCSLNQKAVVVYLLKEATVFARGGVAFVLTQRLFPDMLKGSQGLIGWVLRASSDLPQVRISFRSLFILVLVRGTAIVFCSRFSTVSCLDSCR